MEAKFFKYGTDFAPFVEDKRLGSLQSYKPPTSFEYDLPRGLTGREYLQHSRKDKVFNIGGAVMQDDSFPSSRSQKNTDFSSRDRSYDALLQRSRLTNQLPRVVETHISADNYEFPGSRAEIAESAGIQQRQLLQQNLARLITNAVVPRNATSFGDRQQQLAK